MTPQEQLKKWIDEGIQYVYEENGILKSKYAGEVVPCKWCGNPVEIECRPFCEGCARIDRELYYLKHDALKKVLSRIIELLS